MWINSLFNLECINAICEWRNFLVKAATFGDEVFFVWKWSISFYKKYFRDCLEIEFWLIFSMSREIRSGCNMIRFIHKRLYPDFLFSYEKYNKVLIEVSSIYEIISTNLRMYSWQLWVRYFKIQTLKKVKID